MKIKLKKKNIIIALSILIVGVIIATLIVTSKGKEDAFLNTDTCEANNGFFIPAQDGTTITPDLDWKMNKMQPIVVDYVTIDNYDFVTVEIMSDDGKCMKINLALSGDFGIEDPSGLTNGFTTTYLDGEQLGYEEIKSNLKPGTQISVKYLSVKPKTEILDDETCLVNKTSEYYCAMQRVNEEVFGYSPIFLGTTSEDFSEGNRIYINEISTKLTDVSESTE